MMNGFLPTSAPVRAQQWWRTRDQGDSLAVAQQLADIVGVDFYPRHALAARGGRTVYLQAAWGIAPTARAAALGRRERTPADHRRGPGGAVGGGHHSAQSAGPGHVQLPA